MDELLLSLAFSASRRAQVPPILAPFSFDGDGGALCFEELVVPVGASMLIHSSAEARWQGGLTVHIQLVHKCPYSQRTVSTLSLYSQCTGSVQSLYDM